MSDRLSLWHIFLIDWTKELFTFHIWAHWFFYTETNDFGDSHSVFFGKLFICILIHFVRRVTLPYNRVIVMAFWSVPCPQLMDPLLVCLVVVQATLNTHRCTQWITQSQIYTYSLSLSLSKHNIWPSSIYLWGFLPLSLSLSLSLSCSCGFHPAVVHSQLIHVDHSMNKAVSTNLPLYPHVALLLLPL